MAKKRDTVQTARQGRMQVRVSDFTHGLRVYDDVALIRIRSRDYTLLIMEDYFPILGSVRGRVELLRGTEQIDLGAVRGFYLHRDNEFSLLIEEQAPATTEESA